MQIAIKLYKTSHLAIWQNWCFGQIHHLFYNLLSLELKLNSIKYCHVVLIEFTFFFFPGAKYFAKELSKNSKANVAIKVVESQTMHLLSSAPKSLLLSKVSLHGVKSY